MVTLILLDEMSIVHSFDLRMKNIENLFADFGGINPILPGIWKDVVTWGGGIMAPPDFLLYTSSKSDTNTQNLLQDKFFDI